MNNAQCFDEYIERRGSDSLKWDGCNRKFGVEEGADLLPMWLADMDFRTPEPIVEAVVSRARHGVYGYTRKSDQANRVICDWLERRYDWRAEPGWILPTPGVVPAIAHCLHSLTSPGDGVIVQTPVYSPFMECIELNGRVVRNSPLVERDGCYAIDFSDLERVVREDGTTMMLLCNPHNPVGRVWTKDELLRVGELCARNGVILVSDEIHADIMLDGRRHTAIASLSEEILQNTVAAYSPAKTFNLAGLKTGYILAANPDIRSKLERALIASRAIGINSFGFAALEVAYTRCDAWLEDLCAYIGRNSAYLTEFITRRLPRLRLSPPEGTFLTWIDARGLGLPRSELESFMLRKARIAVDFGWWFGQGGEGFFRLNVACPRTLLEKATSRLEAAYGELREE